MSGQAIRLATRIFEKSLLADSYWLSVFICLDERNTLPHFDVTLEHINPLMPINRIDKKDVIETSLSMVKPKYSLYCKKNILSPEIIAIIDETLRQPDPDNPPFTYWQKAVKEWNVTNRTWGIPLDEDAEQPDYNLIYKSKEETNNE